jgi:hypothetical protein
LGSESANAHPSSPNPELVIHGFSFGWLEVFDSNKEERPGPDPGGARLRIAQVTVTAVVAVEQMTARARID